MGKQVLLFNFLCNLRSQILSKMFTIDLEYITNKQANVTECITHNPTATSIIANITLPKYHPYHVVKDY